MIGFGLLVGHLVGDYILQTDFLASNKTNPRPLGKRPMTLIGMAGGGYFTPGTPETRDAWHRIRKDWWIGHLACTIHCLLYTLAIWAFSYAWMPAWGLALCFLAHWPVDRFRLAKWWMMNVTDQAQFATGQMYPWSIVVVDNCFHLLTLYAIAALAGKLTIP